MNVGVGIAKMTNYITRNDPLSARRYSYWSVIYFFILKKARV